MKKRFCAAVLAMAVVLTGCSSGPDLSRVHRNMEAEYMAGLLLKYDANYEEMLDYDRSILNATPTPAPTRTPAAPSATDGSVAGSEGAAGNGMDDSQPVTYISMDEMGTIQGVTLSQEAYELKNSYGSEYANVSAHDGNKLLVVKFRLKNGTSRAKKVSMADANVEYSLNIDGQNMGSPTMTILPNDLQIFNENIPAGKSREAVLIFEIGKSQKVQNVNLYVSKGGETAEISLQ